MQQPKHIGGAGAGYVGGGVVSAGDGGPGGMGGRGVSLVSDGC
jgi:hypothetical protein